MQSAVTRHHDPGRAGYRHGLLSGIMALLLVFSPAPAQNTDDLLELSLEELLAVEIVTASKTGRASSDITQKFDVISGPEISRMISGNRNIAEYIQYLPGASVLVLSRNDANWGAYGGIGPKYMTYMVQGLPVDAFMDPMSIDPAAIDRIEVQRGPASVLYPNYLSQDYAGNQSPLTGTVNLILKSDIPQPSTRVVAGYGRYNTLLGAAYHRQSVGRVRIFGGVSAEKSEYIDYGAPGSWLNMQQDPAYLKDRIHLGSTIQLDKNDRHMISLFGNQTFHQGTTGRAYREYDNRYSLVNAVYRGTLKDKMDLTVKTGLRGYLREWQDDVYDSTGSAYVLDKTSGVSQIILPLDVSLTYDHFNHSNFTIGSDYQYTTYETWSRPVAQDRTSGNDASATQMGAYIQEELQAGDFTFRAGGRLNMVSHDIRLVLGQVPGETNRSWNSLLWSAGVKYRYHEKYTVYANAGKSFMSPSLKSIGGTLPLSDKFVPGRNGQLPNPDLEPEDGLGLDLGLDGELPFALRCGIRAFSTTITDAIIDNVISQNPSQTMSVNTAGKTVAQGIEFSLARHAGKKMDWFLNGTYTRSEIVAPDDPDQDGNEIPFVPAVLANAGATVYLPYGIGLSPYLHYSGRIYDSSSGAGRTAYDINEVLNLQVSKKFTISGSRTVNVQADLHNLTGNTFTMPWAFRNPGFQYDLKVTTSF